MNPVTAHRAKVIIPTYEVGEAEKYPVFLEKRVYQGSSGSVYPHPVIESISDDKIDKEWDVIYIENDYIKLMIMPSLGGRIQMAYDKIKERHFVYYNHVIKPALVGLTGPWISGGIEFNWPQHHRPSTYDPIDSSIETHDDGSITVWVSEVERMFRTKGMAGFRLYPDKAYLEIEVRLYNRTPHPQTFLWWANPAVKVNDHYQSVFPPDVNAVFDHGKRDVSEFPIAVGEYYKVNYAPGTDISRYRNIPVPTSYMAITSDYDFVGGYEHDTQGGLLHVADHHVSPGKKQWTWGNGAFGHAWDRNLTDADGPYIELMCGVYTDNQPDFSWMHPYEEKQFKQYFMPYSDVGMVKNATKEALVNLELIEDQVIVKVYVTAQYDGCKIILSENNNILIDDKMDLSPSISYERTIPLGSSNFNNLEVSVKDSKDVLLVSWSPSHPKQNPIPEPAKPAQLPSEIKSVEELFLRGLHLEQYRHATYDPTDYYLEALARQPTDIRANNAMGDWCIKRGLFKRALAYFDTAITTLTDKNPNPYYGEPYFNKGLTLLFLNRNEEAYQAFFKSSWNSAWQDAAYFHLSQIDCGRGDYYKALELVNKALIKNWHNHKARHLKAIILRLTDQRTKAEKLIEDSLEIDRFNFGIIYERYLLTGNTDVLISFQELLRDNPHNYIEYAISYADSHQYQNAINLLELYAKDKKAVYPMIYYLLASYYVAIGDSKASMAALSKAQLMPMDYCFPNRLEEVIALQDAITTDVRDAKARYYIGNFWYHARQYDLAHSNWEASLSIDNDNPICHRNISLLYYNKRSQQDLAVEHLSKALSLDNESPRVLMELDQMYKKLNYSIIDRLDHLEKYPKLVDLRDDLYLERAALYNLCGKHQIALGLLEQRQFHPWEGGEGKVSYHYVTAKVELAKSLIRKSQYQKAIELLVSAKNYPENLGEGKLYGTQENDIDYWIGEAFFLSGDNASAITFWNQASHGLRQLGAAMFYNDQKPEKIFYQGLALMRLGKEDEAAQIFNDLKVYGVSHMDDEISIDYFAISLPDLLIWDDDLDLRNRIHCHFLIGLGEMGLSNYSAAVDAFSNVLKYDAAHVSAQLHLQDVHSLIPFKH